MRFWPAVIGSGESVLVIDRSAEPVPTVVVAVALLLAGVGSVVEEPAVAVLVMVEPFVSEALVATTSVKDAVPDAGNCAIEQLTVPVPPTEGLVQDQPAAGASETKVVPAGSVSAIVAFCASLGPTFVAVMV